MSTEDPTGKARRISSLEAERLNSNASFFDVLRLDLQFPHAVLEPTPMSEYERQMAVRARTVSREGMDSCFRAIRTIGQILVDSADELDTMDKQRLLDIGFTLDFLGEVGDALGTINSNAAHRLELAAKAKPARAH